MAAPQNTELYHEQQRLMRCAIHTLNNLFQEQSFTKESLDAIAHALAPTSVVNPHKNMLGLGNYDVNVIISALRSKGYTIQWWDRRKELNTIPFAKVFGLIINYVTWKWFGLWESRHWFSMRRLSPSLPASEPVDTVWYSFDSNLNSPHPFANENELITYLQGIIKHKRGEILLVVPEEPENAN